MAKFSDVAQGTRGRKAIKLPLPGAHLNDTGEWVGPVVELDVRAVREDEYTTILSRALAFAKKHGLDEPGEGDPLYEQGVQLHTLAVACVDRESPKDAPLPFFDGGFEQIHTSEVMTPEVVAYLYLQQQIYQDEVNPLMKSMDPAEFMAAAISTAKGEQSFFVSSRPGMQWSFVHIMATQLMSALSLNSISSTSSEPHTTIPSSKQD